MRKIITLMFLSITLFSACVKESFNSDQISDKILISPSFAAPLAYANFTMANVISSDTTASIFLRIDDQNLIHLIFHTDLEKFSTKDLIGNILKQDTFVNFEAVKDFNVNDFNNKQKIVCTKSVDYEFNMEKEKQYVDSFKVKTFKLKVDNISSFSYNGYTRVLLPTVLTSSGQPYSVDLPNNNQQNTSIEVDLSNTTIKLKEVNGKKNIMPIIYTLNMEYSSQNVTSTDMVTTTVTANDIEASSIFGNLGQVEKELSTSSIDLKYNTKVIDGSLWFANPKLDLVLKNSLGVPMQLSNDGIKIDLKDAAPEYLSGIPNKLLIENPGIDKIGSTKTTHIYVDNNSNLSSIISKWPTKISFGGIVLSNPTAGTYNYVTDSSYFQPSIDLDVPMDMEIFVNKFTDTTEVNIASLTEEDADKITLAKFYVALENGLPTNATAQVYFTNENYKKLDSLFIEPVTVDAAPLGSNGKVSASVYSNKVEELKSAKLRNVLKSKYMILRMGFKTTNATPQGPGHSPVKIYANYKLGMKISVAVSTNLGN